MRRNRHSAGEKLAGQAVEAVSAGQVLRAANTLSRYQGPARTHRELPQIVIIYHDEAGRQLLKKEKSLKHLSMPT